MKIQNIRIVEPLVLIDWCPQCKKILKEYPPTVVAQELMEDEIRHKTESFDNRDHTPYLMVRVVA